MAVAAADTYSSSVMWRPPANRVMRTLDRSFFHKTLQLQAARIFDNKNISRIRSLLERSNDALVQDRLATVCPDPDAERARTGKKCVLLRPQRQFQPDTPSATTAATTTAEHYSPALHKLATDGLIAVVPYQLHLDYSYWTYHDIISAILPEDEHGEIPSGFSQVGHVAHLNLRDDYLKYKHLIAEIIMDKNPGVRTVINKTDDVGEESEFRTFKYEVLAGPDDMNVTVSEENCIFTFDYSKVYWNSRLNTEHRRLVSLFHEGDAVCDVMAGIGPFAVPAGKKKIFVWANDLNPDSVESMRTAIARNKVQDFVRAFNQDGGGFIRSAVAELAQSDQKVEVFRKPSKKDPAAKPEVLQTLQRPRTFQHFVMNLPASAIAFLSSFIGLYTPEVRQHLPQHFLLPLIHVYCFSTKSDDNVEEGVKICEDITRHLQHPMKPGMLEDGDVEVHDVRDVAPRKRMFCATFRLPKDVAFRAIPA